MTPIYYDQTRTIYIISGPCGVGKSTISQELAKEFQRSCYINGDDLYHMVVGGYTPPWKDDGTYRNLLWKNIDSILENFTARGFVSVVDYVVFPDDLAFLNTLKDKYNVDVKYAVLMASEETIVSRDSRRGPNDRMGKRAIELLNQFKNNLIDPRFVIDTSSQSIPDTISIILHESRFLT